MRDVVLLIVLLGGGCMVGGPVGAGVGFVLFLVFAMMLGRAVERALYDKDLRRVVERATEDAEADAAERAFDELNRDAPWFCPKCTAKNEALHWSCSECRARRM